jgi:hypothetical protein
MAQSEFFQEPPQLRVCGSREAVAAMFLGRSSASSSVGRRGAAWYPDQTSVGTMVGLPRYQTAARGITGRMSRTGARWKLDDGGCSRQLVVALWSRRPALQGEGQGEGRAGKRRPLTLTLSPPRRGARGPERSSNPR